MSEFINISSIILRISVLLCLILCCIFIIYIYRKSKQYNKDINNMIGFYLYCLSIFLINISLLWKTRLLSDLKQLILSSIPIITSITFIFLKQVFNEIIEKENIDSEYKFLVRKLENDERYYRLMNEYANKLSIMRHDFKHQIEIAYYAFENNDNSVECQKLLNDLSADLEATRPSMYCNSRLINIITSMKIKDLSDMHIKTTTDILLSGSLVINENAICSIINNVFDEAREIIMEASNLNKITNPDVQFSMKNNEHQIVIKLSIYTIKVTNLEKYKNIKKYYDTYFQYILLKYDNDIQYFNDNNIFSIIISIFNTRNEES